MTRLSHEDLTQLRVNEDWTALWTAAIPWVKFAVSSFKTDSREDASQECLLRIGELLPKWDPERGTFSSFVVAKARYAMLDYLRHAKGRSKRGHEKFRPPAELDLVADVPEEESSAEPGYEDMLSVPQGFGDPAEELARLGAPKAVEAFLGRLEPDLALRFRERWGLPILDEEPEEAALLRDVAAARGVHRHTMRNELKRAEQFLYTSQGRVDDPFTASIYPPEGMNRWPQLGPAEDRYPGFWTGRASAMGDVAVWRESVGSVWKDWSWKPTEADILRGAKR